MSRAPGGRSALEDLKLPSWGFWGLSSRRSGPLDASPTALQGQLGPPKWPPSATRAPLDHPNWPPSATWAPLGPPNWPSGALLTCKNIDFPQENLSFYQVALFAVELRLDCCFVALGRLLDVSGAQLGVS